ncbi:MAG: glycosyltransferase [Verrucomicrobia bacterium]|nr:glycosyltransferase [Verrucomicrobiota bacterium]MBS0647184.1 glycosyltransferase [Verrucomicrobiota bacterium]
MSKKHAKSFAIFTHLKTDMGEAVHAQKFAAMLPHATLHDIPALLGEDYATLAQMNLALAEADYAPCISYPHRIEHTHDVSMVLSWNAGVAAMLASGVQENKFTILKLYAHQPQERIFAQLYSSADLLITESLLASQRAHAYGLDRVLYLPHHFTHCEPASRQYVIELAKRLGKTLPAEAIIVGVPSRFEYWKNCEFAVEAVRQLQSKYPLVLVLKGRFPQQSVYPDYEQHFAQMLQAYQHENWLLWDDSWTSYPDVLKQYASFDFCVQPSGAEGGSNVIVELLAMGKPVILLDASTHPYLFKGGALFVPPQPGLRMAQLAYAQPNLDALIQSIEQLCNARERAKWSLCAQTIAHQRFHPNLAQKKIAYMLQALEKDVDFQKIEEEDKKLYGI